MSDLQEIRAEDFLGRDTVAPIPELMSCCVENKSVMVTGAGGSIGSELCRQIISQNPKVLVLFDNSEFNLFNIDAELRGTVERIKLDIEIVLVLGSVLDAAQLSLAIESFAVQTIYHAAAYKHVPIVEANVAAGLRNNLMGTI